ncbi:MAG: HK97 family phage prohead protease [Alphaproteobacteria bacterium]
MDDDQIHRAFSILEVKSIQEELRAIGGIATTPQLDRQGDIVDPMGAKFARELPLLWQHESRNAAVGHVRFGKANQEGITFEASFPKIEEEGLMRDHVNAAWHAAKYRLVRAVSIGFRALKDGFEFMDGGGIRFTKTEILELSLVTIPANSQAVINAIKSIDADQRRRFPGASGNDHPMPRAGVTLIPKGKRS